MEKLEEKAFILVVIERESTTNTHTMCTHTRGCMQANTHKATGRRLTQPNSNYYSVRSLATRPLDVIVPHHISVYVQVCVCVPSCDKDPLFGRPRIFV